MFLDSCTELRMIGRGATINAIGGMVMLLSAVIGCGDGNVAVSQSTSIQHTATNAESGTLVMIPGIVGQVSDLAGMRDGLCDAGLRMRIEIIPWETSAFQPIKNLTDYQANLDRAARIADRLTQLKRGCPERPLCLLGNSGGGGLAILAVEMLPEDVVLDQLILTAAAVSNDYDLFRVRPQCRSIVNFYSRMDGIVGWGTSLFGTIDRKNTLSAGHCGFLSPEGVLRVEDGLIQIEYNTAWARLGHDGSHLGYRSRKWAEVVLSEWLNRMQMTAAGIVPAIDSRIANGDVVDIPATASSY